MNVNITPEQIMKHRADRKEVGLVGCQDGSDMPLRSLRGISWRMDTKGRQVDHPDFDEDDPHCFCHDCRRTFDPDGTHDLKLINMGKAEAIRVYSDLIRATLPTRSNGGGIASPSLPTRTMTEHPEAYKMGVPREVLFAPPPPLFLQRSMSLGVPSPPPVDTCEQTPLTLASSRMRDIVNETPKQRLKGDLSVLRGEIQNKLVRVMDSRRRAVALEGEDREEFLESIHQKESALWAKLDAVDLLLKD